jgi:hypothetical protein
VETVENEGDNVEMAASYLGIDPAIVTAALDYYLDHRDEIQDWIERNRALAEAAEADWLRHRAHNPTM